MANAGDTFTVELNQAQLEWGTFRFTGSRGLRYGEGYLKIPKPVALNLQLFNGNHTSGYDILGENIFHATSADGLFTGTLRSEGCSNAGDPYAKQFAGDKDLMALGYWYSQINAQIGDLIRVTFTSPADVVLEKL
jgi:hypothetical protein